jgi:hypothetical protein
VEEKTHTGTAAAGRLSIEKERREKRLVEAMAMRRKEQEEEVHYILYQKHIFSR